MDVSSQDPPLMAMDLSKSYNPLTCGRSEAVDLAKKPEWYHRRPAGCSTDMTSAFRSRTSSSYSSLSTQPGVRCRDVELGGESLGSYVNSALAPGVDLYHDGVHSSLWHAGFYRTDQSSGPVPESSGGEESDSGSDVIFLVSSAKEPLLCSSFIQDNVDHMMEPVSPTASSPDEGTGCFLLPQPMSSPSPDSSYSEDSSDSSVDIPVQHTRPVVLLSDLGAVYGNRGDSAIDISSDDSEVVEVSVTDSKRKTRCSPQSENEDAPAREVRRSARVRKPASELSPFTCSVTRQSLKRQAKHDAVGIYNESCDSDDLMEYAAKVSSSEESLLQPNLSRRASSTSEQSEVEIQTDGKSPPERRLRRKISSEALDKPLSAPKTRTLVKTKQKQELRTSPPPPPPLQKAANRMAVRRKRKRRPCTGPPDLFTPSEPEIKLKYANAKEKKCKKSDFCPFVHMEQRLCRVVNYEDEDAAIRSSRGRLRTVPASLTGFVPTTSCFQLGRPSPDSQCQVVAPLCCLCRQTANSTGLGDLHGPYYRSGPSAGHQDRRTLHERSNGHLVNSSEDDCAADESSLRSGAVSPAKVPLCLDECWIHEDCGIWSAGVFLVRGKLYGLEEAARLAQEMTCSACQQTGAIVGCFQKGCPRNYHYTCAMPSGCVLNEENFSMRCPEHKNKLFTTVNRRRRR